MRIGAAVREQPSDEAMSGVRARSSALRRTGLSHPCIGSGRDPETPPKLEK